MASALFYEQLIDKLCGCFFLHSSISVFFSVELFPWSSTGAWEGKDLETDGEGYQER